jgi:hypothetical protein
MKSDDIANRKPGSIDSVLIVTAGLGDHPDIAKSVGQMLDSWNRIEFRLIYVFASLTGIDAETSAKILYALKNSAARLDILESVGRHTLSDDGPVVVPVFGPKARSRFIEAIGWLRKALKIRNFYAHCVYAWDTTRSLAPGERRLIAFVPTEFYPSQPIYITQESVAADMGVIQDAFVRWHYINDEVSVLGATRA